MVFLSIRRPLVEPVAPNQDSVRDATNPLKGLEDVNTGIRQVSQALEEIHRDGVTTKAYAEYTTLSAASDKDFRGYLNSVDTSDISQSGVKINEYINGPLRRRYDDWLSSISDRQVRQHFRAQAEQDLRGYHKLGLESQLGAQLEAHRSNFDTTVNNVAEKFKYDASDENYHRQVGHIKNYVNSLNIDPITKQKWLNYAERVLNKEHVINNYQKNPDEYAKYITVSYQNVSAPKDPNSLADLVDSAGDREMVVNEDLSGSTKCEGWNRLGTIERRQLLEHLIGKDNAANSREGRELHTTIRNHSALFQQGKTPPKEEMAKVTLDRCMRVYGNDRGIEMYNLYHLQGSLAPQVAELKLMSDGEAKEFFEKLDDKTNDPTLSAEATVKYAQYRQLLAKAYTDSQQERHKDPIKWGRTD